PVGVAVPVANRLRAQGHGTIVVLSSVAGERARRSNFVYGSTKAGLDAFFQGLGDALVGTGASVMIVRPGFVHTKMSEGLERAAAAGARVARGEPAARPGGAGRRPAGRGEGCRGTAHADGLRRRPRQRGGGRVRRRRRGPAPAARRGRTGRLAPEPGARARDR